MSETSKEEFLQRKYYAETAARYDAMHLGKGQDPEHELALSMMLGAIDYLQVRSVLDIGSGTGRTLFFLKHHRPNLRILGVEPVEELRAAGYRKGLSQEELVDGDATRLRFADGQFDLVCEFATLHHIRRPEAAVAEMLRTSSKAIFISDSNNFGQGSSPVRALKQIIAACGLWRLANFLKTGGKGYTITEGDGLAYSYSVFTNYAQIRRQCRSVHLMNTMGCGPNLYRTAGHVALLGVK
jgi:SAM-dependent methyltransferase